MKKLRVNMLGLLDGLQTSEHDPVRYYLDVNTGEVIDILVPDLLGDPSFEDPDQRMIESNPIRYNRVPNVPGRTQYRWMEEFVDGLEDNDVADRLRIALAGRGAFGRFREVLGRWPDLQQRWYALRQEYLIDEAIRWLQNLGIEAEYELPGPESPPPKSSRPRGPRLSIVHLLVLGSPQGNPEAQAGRIKRVLVAPDAAEARSWFRALTREWCEMRGIGFRKRFVDNKNEFELEGLTLCVRGNDVEAYVDVPPDVLRLLNP